MSTGTLNTWIRGRDGKLLKAWMVDVAIQRCGGNAEWLVDYYPEIIDNLKQRYSKPAAAKDITNYATLTDQGGNTVELVFVGYKTDTDPTSPTYGQGKPYSEMRSVLLTSPAMTACQIACQVRPVLADLATTAVVDGQILVTTIDRGLDCNVSLGAGNTAAVEWCVTGGSGWRVYWRNYVNAKRINIYPGPGKFVNHIEFDAPPGEYLIWSRCCHQNNEETAPAYVLVRCGDHLCVNLVLPTVDVCGKQDWFPMADRAINDGPIQLVDDQIAFLKVVKYVAGLEKAAMQANLNLRLVDAELADDPAALQARINAIAAVVAMLPECY